MEQQNQTLARYYSKRKKIKKRRAIAFYTLLMVLLIVVITVLSLTVFFNISNIKVSGNSHYNTQTVIKTSGLEKGQNLFRLNKFKIIDNLKKELPYLDEVVIDRKLPVSIEIKVKETSPFLCISAGGSYYLVDRSLKVLEKVSDIPQNVATVSGIIVNDAKIGGYITDKNEKEGHLLQLTTVLFDTFGANKVTKIDINAVYDITVEYEDRVEIKFGTLENISEKARLVKYVLDENSPSEHAQIDVSSGKRAYYKADD